MSARRQKPLPLGFPDRVAPARQQPPKVLANDPIAEGGVRVTFSLPGLRRALVHVPESSWLEGSHLRVGAQLAGILEELGWQEDQQWSRLRDGE